VTARRLVNEVVEPRLSIIDAEGRVEARNAFQTIAPGLFRWILPIDTEEIVRLKIESDPPGKTGWLVASDPMDDHTHEEQVNLDNGLDLKSLASLTGGQAFQKTANINATPWSRATTLSGHRVWPLWPWCLVLALLIFLAEILVRRWPSGNLGAA